MHFTSRSIDSKKLNGFKPKSGDIAFYWRKHFLNLKKINPIYENCEAKTGFPIGLENLKKMGRHFSVREKSRELEQTGKVTRNHTKYWNSRGISDKCYYLLKWVKFSVENQNIYKKYWKNERKYWNFLIPEKWKPCNIISFVFIMLNPFLSHINWKQCICTKFHLFAHCFGFKLVHEKPKLDRLSSTIGGFSRQSDTITYKILGH